jgi:hypothetical protein
MQGLPSYGVYERAIFRFVECYLMMALLPIPQYWSRCVIAQSASSGPLRHRVAFNMLSSGANECGAWRGTVACLGDSLVLPDRKERSATTSTST